MAKLLIFIYLKVSTAVCQRLLLGRSEVNQN
jgi:hypothetical protein